MKNIKTLVIHPKDKTTDFLKPIYNKRNFTVLNTDFEFDKVTELIKNHDKIIMLGHGTPFGLLAKDQFANLGNNWMTARYAIDNRHAEYLKNKECIFIWCFADRFVKKHGLKGLATGMIISEEIEARYVGIDHTPEQIADSNKLFAKSIRKAMSGMESQLPADKNDDLKKLILKNYSSSPEYPVLNFNRENIFYINEYEMNSVRKPSKTLYNRGQSEDLILL